MSIILKNCFLCGLPASFYITFPNNHQHCLCYLCSSLIVIRNKCSSILSCPCGKGGEVEVSLEELNKNLAKINSTLKAPEEDLHCANHPKKAEFFCFDCRKGLCSECFETHKSHKAILYTEFQKKLKKKLSLMKDKSYSDFKGRIISCKYEFEKTYEAASSIVIKKVDEIIGLFNDIKERMIKEQEENLIVFTFIHNFYRNFYCNVNNIHRYDFTKIVDVEFEEFTITPNDSLIKAISGIHKNIFEKIESKSEMFSYNNKIIPFEINYSFDRVFERKAEYEITSMEEISVMHLFEKDLLVIGGNGKQGQETISIYNVRDSFKMVHTLTGDQNSTIADVIQIGTDKMMSISNKNNKIKLWSTSTNHKKYVSFFLGHSMSNTNCIYKSKKNQNIIYTGSTDGEIIQWDIGLMKRIKGVKSHKGKINELLELKKENKILSCGDDGYIKGYNSDSLIEEFKFFKIYSKILSLIQLYDTLIVSCDSTGELSLWDLEGKKEKASFKGHGSEVTKLIKLKQNTICSISTDSTIRFWSVAPTKIGLIQTIKAGEIVNNVVFLKTGEIITCSANDVVKIYN